jgi:branched-chain amino acid transport system ATP-binding protein
MLRVTQLAARYGPIQVLRNIDLEVQTGEIVCLLGGNAAGKTTTLKSILGLLKPSAGSIEFDGLRIDGKATEEIVRLGIALVPESRRILARMSVLENLTMGAYCRRQAGAQAFGEDLERVYGLFPRLKERAAQYGGTLSGGEQQMLAIGRALMARPRLLLMDEPSMGLAPVLVDQVFDIVRSINGQGVTILLVEQNATMALSIAHRGYVLQEGAVAMHGPAAELLEHEGVRDAYLGGSAD